MAEVRQNLVSSWEGSNRAGPPLYATQATLFQTGVGVTWEYLMQNPTDVGKSKSFPPNQNLKLKTQNPKSKIQTAPLQDRHTKNLIKPIWLETILSLS